MTKILKEKTQRRRIRRRVPKIIWDFFLGRQKYIQARLEKIGETLWKYWKGTPSAYKNEWYLSFTIYAGIGTIRLMICYSRRYPLFSHSLVCIKNHLFIVGIGLICDKEHQFIYPSDQYDRTCVLSQVTVLWDICMIHSIWIWSVSYRILTYSLFSSIIYITTYMLLF